MYLVPEADLPCRLQLRRRLAGLHRLHQLPGEGFCLCSLLRAEGTDCFKVEESVGLAAPAGSFCRVIRVTTPLIGVRVLVSRAAYLRNSPLLVTGTRTSRGSTLPGRSRNSSTDSLQALAPVSPSFEP